MAVTWLHCDRCEKDFRAIDTYHGLIPKTVGGYRFYNLNFSLSIWERFARGTEEVICRDCMWADEEFLVLYPHFRSEKIKTLIIVAGIK